MDKRFFLALFLSIVVIGISQFLFPPAKPAVVQKPAADSTVSGVGTTSSSTVAGAQTTTPSPTASATTVAPNQPGTTAVRSVSAVADTATVTTPKTIYRF